jgi:capsular exopolysaccharide synthesis family protein
VEARYDAIRAREGRLRRRLARDERGAGRLRELGVRWELLKGEVDTARALHASLLKQRMDTAVNADLVASNVRVIDRPEVPLRPSRPNAPLNLVIGLAAGLVFGIGTAFARDHLDDSVKGHGDIEEFLHTPTLATIPNFDETAPRAALGMATVRALVARGRGAAADEAAGPPRPPARTELVVMRAPWSGVAEAFRSMRTAVLFAAPDDPPRVALVTSARPSEGKTVASLNLALVLAQSGARVVLVDADLRHPRAHAALGASNAVGLANVLLGEATLADVTQPVDDLPLLFVPAGPPPPNPSELIGSARMRAALATLRETYDFVVIDTPPVLAVTDAVLLAREADGVILVVKGDETPRELVRRTRDRLIAAGGRLLGVVVNNVRAGWSDQYGGYAQYGYPATGAAARPRRGDVANGQRA